MIYAHGVNISKLRLKDICKRKPLMEVKSDFLQVKESNLFRKKLGTYISWDEMFKESVLKGFQKSCYENNLLKRPPP